MDIRAIYRRSRTTDGSPRIHAELQAQEVRCGRQRVERLMRTEGLQAKHRRRWRCTTNAKHDHGVAPNQLARHVSVRAIGELDRVWAGDITYVPTRAGWLYLAVILDLAARRVIGWAMEPTLAQSLPSTALRVALVQRAPRPGLLHHADRGVQYAATDYQALVAARAIRPSMSRRGDCYDNAVVESFFATGEWELIERNDWHTRREAQAAIVEYIEGWYHRQRRHST